MAYIKIDFDLYDINDDLVKVDFNTASAYRFMEYDLNKCLLDYIIDKQYFCNYHSIKTMDLNDILQENKNICVLKPIHISLNKNWYRDDIIVRDATKLATFTLYIETSGYVICEGSFEKLKDCIIGNRLEGLFNEIYAQLVDGWGENLNFDILNYETLKNEDMFPEFKIETMKLVEGIGE